MQVDANNELSWLAFRYIADELSAEQRDTFEQRLAVDQQAREEVARAVEMTQAVACVHAQAPAVSLRPRRWLRPVTWTVAAAAVLLIAVFIVPHVLPIGDQALLARMWFRSTMDEPLAEPDVTELLAGTDDPTSISDELDLTVPAWLIEAVSGSLDSQRPDGNWEET